MTLFEGQENQTYRIKAIQTQDKELKHRLLSFGITKDCEIKLDCFTANKATLKIQVKNAKVALRDSEAQHIIVENV